MSDTPDPNPESPAPPDPNQTLPTPTLAQIQPIMTLDQLEDLKRMRVVGMNFIERLERRGLGLLRFDEQEAFNDRSDICLGFARVARAVRQIVVLEQETAGLRQPAGMRAPANANVAPAVVEHRAAPIDPDAEGEGGESDLPESDLNDLRDRNDLDDYDRGPTEQVVAKIKATLGIAPRVQDATGDVAAFEAACSRSSLSSSSRAKRGDPVRAAISGDTSPGLLRSARNDGETDRIRTARGRGPPRG